MTSPKTRPGGNRGRAEGIDHGWDRRKQRHHIKPQPQKPAAPDPFSAYLRRRKESS
jgi:hypothetical protein